LKSIATKSVDELQTALKKTRPVSSCQNILSMIRNGVDVLSTLVTRKHDAPSDP
jgi:hypothetical protein